jgi:hypothetical protein
VGVVKYEICSRISVEDKSMSEANADGSSGNIDKNLAWWVPVRNSSIMALAMAPLACCLCYFPLFELLPQPPCIGGYTHEYASEVRVIAMLFGMGFCITLPVIAILGILGGILVHFIFNAPGRNRVVERVSIGLGITISLVFWLVITILLNRNICGSGRSNTPVVLIPPSPVDAQAGDTFWLDAIEVTNARYAFFFEESCYRIGAEKLGIGWVFEGSQTVVSPVWIRSQCSRSIGVTHRLVAPGGGAAPDRGGV